MKIKLNHKDEMHIVITFKRLYVEIPTKIKLQKHEMSLIWLIQ